MGDVDPQPRAGVMASGGRYAAESVTQHGAAAFGFPLIEPAIEELQPPGHGPLLLADFGAAQGTNSLEAMRRALLRSRGACPGGRRS